MADGEFRIAGAFVDVRLQDNTAADEAKLRARLEKSTPVDFETALKDPGNVQAVKARISSGPAATIRTDADTALAQAKIKELSSRRNAAVVSLDADVSKAEARIKDLESKRGKTKLDVDAEIGKAQAKIEALKAKRTRILLEVDIDKSALAKAGREVDSETEKMAARANAQFSAMALSGAFAGLPAAAAVGAAGVSAALVGVPLLFAGIGAAALKGNEQVSSAFSTTRTRVVGDTQAMSAVLAGPLSAAAGDLGASFTRIRPMIQTAMTGSVPAVRTLTGAVTDFAEGAMPGMVAAVQAADAPLKGLRSLAGQAGTGLADMLANMSRGADGAGQSLGTLGGIIHDAEGFAGTLFANLASNGNPVLQQFRGDLQQVEGVLSTLTSAGFPALSGAFSGFSNVASGALGVVQLFSSALGGWAAPLGQVGGALFATNSMAKLFGTSLGEVGFGLKALMPVTDAAGNKTTAFGTAVSGAKGFTDKAAKGFTALAEGGLNPLGIAMGGVTVGLALLGQAHQDAAAKAAAQATRETDLAGALRQSNGAIDGNVQALAAKSLQEFNAGDGTRNLLEDTRKLLGPGAIPGLTDAYLGNAGATQQLVGRLRTLQAAHTDTTTSEAGVNNQMDKTAIAANDLANIIGSQSGTFQGAVQRNKDLATATDTSAQSSRNDVQTKQAQIGALLALNDALLATADKDFAYAQAQTALKAAHDGVTQALKSKTSTTLQVTQAEQGEEGAMLSLIHAAEAKAAADYKGSDAGEKSRQTMAAAGLEALRLADQYGAKLPSSVRQYIGSLDNAQLAAMGATRTIDETGAAVIRLPGYKPIRIELQGAQQVTDTVDRLVRDNNGKVINIRVNTAQGYTNVGVGTGGKGSLQAAGGVLTPYAAGGIAAFAAGGMSSLTPMQPIASMVPKDTWRVVGDNMRVPEAYIPIDPNSKRSQALLAQTNEMMGSSDRRGTQNAGPTTINQYITINGADKSNPEIAAAMGAELNWQMRAR
jgi:hypothetical protein